MSAEVVDDLARARAAFDAGRAGRSGAGRIPEHLWMFEACRLAAWSSGGQMRGPEPATTNGFNFSETR